MAACALAAFALLDWFMGALVLLKLCQHITRLGGRGGRCIAFAAAFLTATLSFCSDELSLVLHCRISSW